MFYFYFSIVIQAINANCRNYKDKKQKNKSKLSHQSSTNINSTVFKIWIPLPPDAPDHPCLPFPVAFTFECSVECMYLCCLLPTLPLDYKPLKGRKL